MYLKTVLIHDCLCSITILERGAIGVACCWSNLTRSFQDTLSPIWFQNTLLASLNWGLVFLFLFLVGWGEIYNSTVPLERRSAARSSPTLKWKTRVSSEPLLGSVLRRTGTIQHWESRAQLTGKHEDQSSKSQKSHKSQASVVATCNPSMKCSKTGSPGQAKE